MKWGTVAQNIWFLLLIILSPSVNAVCYFWFTLIANFIRNSEYVNPDTELVTEWRWVAKPSAEEHTKKL